MVNKMKLAEVDLPEQFMLDKLYKLTGDNYTIWEGYKNSFEIRKNDDTVFVSFIRGAISVFIAGAVFGVEKYGTERH